MALSKSGSVFTWGLGEDGQLGHGDSADYNVPKLVEPLNAASFIAAGYK